jgi:hypothetical protein
MESRVLAVTRCRFMLQNCNGQPFMAPQTLQLSGHTHLQVFLLAEQWDAWILLAHYYPYFMDA